KTFYWSVWTRIEGRSTLARIHMSVHISSRLVVSPAGCGTVSCTGGALRGIGRITRSTRAGYEFDPASSPGSAPHSFHNGSAAGTPPSHLRRRTFRQSRCERLSQRHGPVAEQSHPG